MFQPTRAALLLCAVFVFLALNAPAQTQGDGTLSGTVTSAGGAPIAGATIELENTGTGARTRVSTDASGNYRFERLASGTYRIVATTNQYSGTPSNDIVFDASRAKTVNVTIQAGASTAPTTAALITVEDATPVQGLETPQIRSAWNTRDTQYLPTPNFMERNGAIFGAYNLSLLNRGLVHDWGLGPGRGPVVGGRPPLANNFLVEGVDNNNRANPGPLTYVSNEATTEFVTYQNQFPPEYGHTSGGQFNTIIRTGTNQVHGGAFWYLQNRNLNAIDPAYGRQGLTENPAYDQNRFGGNIGFPIIKDKLFFFGNVEYIPLGVANTPFTPVFGPTAEGFAALSRISGISQQNLGVLQQYLPAAATSTSTTTVNGVSIPIGVAPFSGKNVQNTWNGVGSLDWRAGNSDNLRARYVHNLVEASSFGAQLPGFITPVKDRSLLANVSWYHNLGARGINELRLGYNRFQHFIDNPNAVFPGLTAFPNISIQNDLNAQLGMGFAGLETAGLNTYQLSENVNFTVGRHTIRVGYDGRRYIGPLNFASQGVGTYSFSNLQRFLLDQNPDVFGSRTFGDLTYSGNNWNHYFYANDGWRIMPNLHLNLGVRYEYVTIPYTLTLQELNSIADVPGVLEFRRPETQKANFAPRIGLAWSPNNMGDFVFRTGFGMNYDAVAWNSILPNVTPGVTTTEIVSTVTPIFGFFGNGAIINRFPVDTPTLTPEQARAMTSSYIPDQTIPYTMQWNASIEGTVARRFILNAGYLGVRGVHQPVQDVLNRSNAVTDTQNLPLFYSPPTQAQLNALPLTLTQLQNLQTNPLASSGFTNSIYTIRPDGNSMYHGLLVGATQRFSGGFQMKANYTWSHLLDDLSGPNLLGSGTLPFLNTRTGWHSSIYDHRHAARLTALWDLGGLGSTQNWVRDVVANLTIAGIYTYESPNQIPLTSGVDALLGGGFPSGVFTNPSGSGFTGSGVTSLTNGSGQIVGYLANNPNAQFVQAGQGSFPIGGSAFIQGMRPINNFDVAVFKRFAVRDRFSFEVHAQAYNILNHPQFLPGSINAVNGGANQNLWSFLVPGSAAFGDVTQAFTSHPRMLQVGLRFLF